MYDYNKKLDRSIYRIYNNARENEIISVIVFTNEKRSRNFSRRLKDMGCFLKYELDILGAYAIDVYADKIPGLANHDSVAYLASDIEATTCLDIARPVVGAADSKYNGRNVGIAVLDTGVHPHADLTEGANRIVKFVDFVENKDQPYDDNGHGTHCAGIIAGSGFSSAGKYTGIAPSANIIGIKVMNAKGEGRTSDILAGLDWIWKNKDEFGIRVASISLGAPSSGKRMFDPLMLAVEKLWDSGIVVVAAAGNEGPASATIGTPGVSGKIITVGCSNDHGTIDMLDDTIAPFSSRGPSPYAETKPDIVAPGVDIMSLSNEGNGYRSMSGTSMSTPMVAGAVALLLDKNPRLTPNEIKSRLIANAYSLRLPKTDQGSGVLNITKILAR